MHVIHTLLPEARVGDHGYSSRLFVCDSLFYSPGWHSTAFTAWIAFTQRDFGLNSDVKASLLNKSMLARGLYSRYPTYLQLK